MNLSETDKELIAKIDERLKHYKLISEPDYLAQQKEVEKEWKPQSNEWFKTRDGFLYLCYQSDNSGIYGDNQFGDKSQFVATIFTKPTPEEIFTHLKGIAERKYPVGTKVKFGEHKKTICKPLHFEYKKGNLECADFEYWAPDKGWAEVISELKPEERWRPKHGDRYWFIDTRNFVPFCINSTMWMDTDFDKEAHKHYNCYKTEELATKIREILK